MERITHWDAGKLRKGHVFNKALLIEWDFEILSCWNCGGMLIWSDSNVSTDKSYTEITCLEFLPTEVWSHVKI